jgi:hypothetical protein
MDVKRVHVNSQVTAIISLLEVLGNLTTAVLATITKPHNLVRFIHVEIFYLILLPHVFIMNTSQNKKRIIEYGWKNVFLNLVGWQNTSQESIDNIAKDASCNQNINNKEENFIPNIHSNKIFTTNESRNMITSNNAKNISTINTKQTAIDLGDMEQDEESPKEAVMNVIDIEEEEYQNEILQKLRSSMVQNIADKEKFIEHLNKLVVFQKCSKQGKIVTELELESEILFNVR